MLSTTDTQSYKLYKLIHYAFDLQESCINASALTLTSPEVKFAVTNQFTILPAVQIECVGRGIHFAGEHHGCKAHTAAVSKDGGFIKGIFEKDIQDVHNQLNRFLYILQI